MNGKWRHVLFCHLASGGNSWNSGGQKNSFSKNGTCISSMTRLFIYLFIE